MPMPLLARLARLQTCDVSQWRSLEHGACSIGELIGPLDGVEARVLRAIATEPVSDYLAGVVAVTQRAGGKPGQPGARTPAGSQLTLLHLLVGIREPMPVSTRLMELDIGLEAASFGPGFEAACLALYECIAEVVRAAAAQR